MGVPEVSAETKTCPQCAEDIRLQALVCHYCGQEFAVRRVGYCARCHDQVEVTEDERCPRCGRPVIDVVTESQPAVAPAPAAPAPRGDPAVHPLSQAAPAKRSMSLPMRLLIAVVVGLVLAVGAVFVGMMLREEAADPGDLAERFPEAGVVCDRFEVLYDTQTEKVLGCVSQDSHLIEVFTYGERPSAEEFVRNACAVRSAVLPPEGAYVLGDGFIININQGTHAGPTAPATPIDVATRLAALLGGEAAEYTCP
jgi:hypothetical protein